MAEYKLSYTAEDIDERLGKISQLSEDIENLKNSGGSGVSVQADWAQTDENAANFIKNKPFGEGGTVQTEIIAKGDKTFSFSESDGGYVYVSQVSPELSSAWNADWTSAIITWDGTAYTCEPQSQMGIKFIGNIDILMGSGDSGVPFIMGIMSAAQTGAPTDMFMIMSAYDYPSDPANAPDITHNVECLTTATDITTIDPKYIKEVSWNKIADRPFGMAPAGTVILDTATINCSDPEYDELYAGAINVKNIHQPLGNYLYAVEFDGVQQTVTGEMSYYDNNSYFVIEWDNNCSFRIYGLPNGEPVMAALVATQGEHSLKITLAEDTAVTINPKFIPKVDGLPEVTTDNNGKTLKVVNGAWTIADGLPAVTVSDAGKFLRVDSNGAWAIEAVQNVGEVGL